MANSKICRGSAAISKVNILLMQVCLYFAEIVKPLHKLTERGIEYIWTQECETAFATLKNYLSSAPVLSFPDFSKPWIMMPVRKELMRISDGNEQLIVYASRSPSKAECKYSVTRKELVLHSPVIFILISWVKILPCKQIAVF